MADFILSRKGFVSDICIAKDAPETAITAAGELVKYLGAQAGIVPVVKYEEPKAGDICLGAKSAQCGSDELNIEVEDGILRINGGIRGILYGVYETLEQVGFRFFTDDCEVIPQEEELTLPEDTKINQKPVFEYRSTSWYGINIQNAAKHRINGLNGRTVNKALGGSKNYEGFVHTLGRLSEMDQPYTDRQPCLTDEKTFQTVMKNLRAGLAENPDAAIASVSQNDSHEWGRGCTCEKCKALDDAEGTPMGSLLPFVNRVAEEIEGEYPELAIDTLAYRYTRKVPKTLKARQNVIIRLCSIECCFSHPIAECDNSVYDVEDGSFADCLKSWADHCGRIYIWDYTTNFSSYHNCFPNFGVLRQNARFFADNNVKGLFEQGDGQTVNGEFGELRTYLITKLLWDPYMDEATYEKHIDEFMAAYYGAGWKQIRSFFDRLQASAKDVHFGIYFRDPTKLFVDPEIEGTWEEKAESFLKKGRAEFAAALEAADSEQRKHIEGSEIQLDLYEWYLLKNKIDALAEDDEVRADLEKELYAVGAKTYAHAVSIGAVTMYEGNPKLLLEIPDFTTEPARW